MMKICDLNTGSARLLRAANDLKDRWIEVQEHWTDTTSRQFQEDFLHPLTPLLNQLNAAIAKFDEIATEAEKQCSDPDRQQFY